MVIFICGIHSIVFAIFHVLFWKLFNWKTDLKKITYTNRPIIQTMNIRAIYFFFLFIVFFFRQNSPEQLLAEPYSVAFLYSGWEEPRSNSFFSG